MILQHLAARGQRVGRGLVVAAVIFAALLALADAADAHASLVSTQPSPGSSLVDSPRDVVLNFSEPVDASPGSVRIFDSSRRELTVEDVRHGASANAVTATLPTLPTGGYVVSWRVVSADGHPISGAFTFAVGGATIGDDLVGAVAQLQPRGASRANGVVSGVARAVAYGSLALAVGATLVAALVWPRGFGDWRTRRLLLATGTVAVVSSLLALGGQGVNARGGGLTELAQWSTWSDVIATRNGGWLLARTAMLALLVAGWASTTRRATTHAARLVVTICAAVAATVCVALAGHASSGPHHLLSLAADIAHVLAFSMWIGGLALVASCVIPTSPRAGATRVTAAFSRLAFAMVVVLVATGTFMAWRQGVEVGHLTASDYGTLLSVKVAIVVVLVALGGVSRRLLARLATAATRTPSVAVAAAATAPEVAADDGAWRTPLRRSIGAEIALSVAVFAVTAMLVNASPPRADDSEPLEVRRSVAGLTLDLVVAPTRTGPAEMHVYISSATTLQPKVEELTVSVSQPDLGGAPITVQMLRAGPAHFQSTGLEWPFAGDWTIAVSVRTDEFTRDSTTATLSVR